MLDVKQPNLKKLRMWFALSCISIVITGYTYYIVYFSPIFIKFKLTNTPLETIMKLIMLLLTIFMLYFNRLAYVQSYNELPKDGNGNPL